MYSHRCRAQRLERPRPGFGGSSPSLGCLGGYRAVGSSSEDRLLPLVPQQPVKQVEETGYRGEAHDVVAAHSHYWDKSGESQQGEKRTGELPLPGSQHTDDSRGQQNDSSPLTEFRRRSGMRIDQLSGEQYKERPGDQQRSTTRGPMNKGIFEPPHGTPPSGSCRLFST